jgi:hypothetical protein
MPILPKEMAVKAEPSVTIPLGQVNYNLYSGLHSGRMTGTGSLKDILGASWVEDLLDQGVALYDYRPPGETDDNIQRFLVHYKLDMQDILGGSGDLEMDEYREMLDELTGTETEIDDVSFEIPSMNMEEPFDVKIPLGEVTQQIDSNIGAIAPATAYLPVQNDTTQYVFPYDILKIPENSAVNFSITLDGLESLTLQDGKLNFKFTLHYSDESLKPKSHLELHNFRLQTDAASAPIQNVTAEKNSVVLDSDTPDQDATGSLSIFFAGAELPQKFDLVCALEIVGSGTGYFELKIEPAFEDYTISGVRGLELTPEQIASLAHKLDPEITHDIGGSLGDTFQATVGEGTLEIDTSEVFPPLAAAGPGDEGWNLEMNLSKLSIKQNPNPVNIEGLSLGDGTASPLAAGPNDLQGAELNNQTVRIGGIISASIPGGTNKLTFQNFPGGIEKGATVTYEKPVKVNMDVSLLSTVTATAEDIGMNKDSLEQAITQELGEDFTAFKEWLNYIHFPAGTDGKGLGVVLEIEELTMPGNLGLYIRAEDFGLVDTNEVFQPLVNDTDPASGDKLPGATLKFLNKDDGGYKLEGDTLPESVFIEIQLGMQNKADQERYEAEEILTFTNVVPGLTLGMTGGLARLAFDWDKMSIKPKDHINGEDDSLPDYPFKGTFPDKDKGEDGIDLSSMPKDLGFYIPEEGAGENNSEDGGEGVQARLYISLERKIRGKDGEWKEDTSGSDDGWNENLRVNLPSLDFRIKYGDGENDRGDNLFTKTAEEQPGTVTGRWTAPEPVEKVLERMKSPDDDGGPPRIYTDEENLDNPFYIYTGDSLPKEGAIPLGNLASELNKNFGGKDLFFEYSVELTGIPEEDGGDGGEDGEILLYPVMFEKKIVVSVDMLLIVPLIFQAKIEPGTEEPIVMTIDPDVDGDIFQRANAGDNGYFDMVTSFGFNVATKNAAGLSAGQLFLENKTDVEEQKYELLVFDFAEPRNNLSLDGDKLEKIKEIWPFIPQASIRFAPGAIVRIERGLNIKLQSVTLRAGGEYTFETGL